MQVGWIGFICKWYKHEVFTFKNNWKKKIPESWESVSSDLDTAGISLMLWCFFFLSYLGTAGLV